MSSTRSSVTSSKANAQRKKSQKKLAVKKIKTVKKVETAQKNKTTKKDKTAKKKMLQDRPVASRQAKKSSSLSTQTTRKKTAKKANTPQPGKRKSEDQNAVGGNLSTKAGSLAVGDMAPVFDLPAGDGQRARLSALRGQAAIVVYFYPKDMTSGCTAQAEAFTRDYRKFQALGVEIIGISPDKPATHGKFAQKHGIPFPLGSDEDHAVAEKYGVWAEKSMYGRRYMGIVRSTFIIDRHGQVAAAWEKVKVPGHSEEVLRKLKELLG